jgi:predicted amidohydrolase
MKIALVQLRTPLLQVEESRKMMKRAIEQALMEGAEIVVLPELATSGYPLNSKEEAAQVAEPMKGETFEMVRGILLEKDSDAIVAYGYPEVIPDGRFYNSMVFVSQYGVEANYRKVALYKADVPWAQKGRKRLLLELKGLLIVPGICADTTDPDFFHYISRTVPDVVLISCCWVGDDTDPPVKWADMAIYGSYVGVADRWGWDREVFFPGRTCLLAPESGEIIGAAPASGDYILFGEVPVQEE